MAWSFIAAVDTDFDGLDDASEHTVGTDPENPDTKADPYGGANSLVTVDAGGNLDGNFLGLIYQAAAATVVTRIGDDCPLAVALRTGGTDLKKTLGTDHLPPAVAGWTGLALMARAAA